MADNPTTNHPSLPSDYVSINDLRDRWLKKQQQNQPPQHQEDEEVRIETTERNKGKAKVQEMTTNHPSLPTNYVTIVDLRERWLKQQQQKEENDRIETTVRDKGKEKVQEVTVDCQFDGISVKNNPHFRNPNPNLIPERGFCRNTKEKARVTVDCRQVDGNSDKNRLQFRNPNPSLIPENGFSRNSEEKAQVTVDCRQGDGNVGKNSRQFPNPNPNLIPERGFCRNSEEKAQVTVDCQVGGKEDRNNPQFRNPNPNLVRERGFRRHSNWNNRRPIHRGFYGGEKMSTHNSAVKGSSSSLEASETTDGVEIEAESVDDGGQLKDAPLMSKEEKTLSNRIWKKERKESKQFAKEKGENEEMIKLNVTQNQAVKASSSSLEASETSDEVEIEAESVVDVGQLKDAPLMNRDERRKQKKKIWRKQVKDRIKIAKKEENEQMLKLNVSKVGAIREKIRETKAKMQDIHVSKIGGIGEKTRETEAKIKDINVSKIGRIVEKTRATEAKMKDINVSKSGGIVENTRGTEAKTKDINVSKIGGIAEKARETEAKMKKVNVSKIGGIGEKTRKTEVTMKEINVSKIGGIEEKTTEIEAKMKEMTVTEQCSPGKEKEVMMVTVKAVPESKSVREVRWGDLRARADRRMGVYGRGRRGFNDRNEPRWANYGEGNRGDKCGLKWVKKGDGAEKVFNNGCVVQDGGDHSSSELVDYEVMIGEG